MIKASGSPYTLIRDLREQKENFEVRKTSKSTLIKFGKFQYLYADGHFNNKHLNLFQAIKKEVFKNIQENEIIPPKLKKSKYFEAQDFEPIAEGEFLSFKKCVEFDVNKAYYSALRHFNYISEEFYQKCIKLPKPARLSLVGSLATQKTIFYYTEGELTSYELVKDETLRRVFFHLVDYIDQALDYFSKLAGDNFLFYWVDGIYLKEYKRADFHKQLISDRFKIEFSFEPIKGVIIYNESEYQTRVVVKKKDDRLKEFLLSNIFVKNQHNEQPI